MRTVVLLLAAVLLLAGCGATAQYEYTPVPMRCDAEVQDAIDCKMLEFNCRSEGGSWLGTECKR